MHEKVQRRNIREQVRDAFLLQSKESPRTQGLTQIGVNILSIGALDRAITKHSGLIDTVFTADEIGYCQNRMGSYAGRLAAKVAVMQSMQRGLSYQEVNIKALPTKQPVVELTSNAQEYVQARAINGFAISISHDEGLAAALIVPITNDNPTQKVGTDIASRERIAALHARHPDRFLRKLFTHAEVDEVEGNTDLLTKKWAGKEAVAKVLGTGLWREGVAWTDIETLSDSEGKMQISLSGGALKHAEQQGLRTWNVCVIQYDRTQITFVIAA